ncbi:LuxR family transcriptional regulator [Acidothermaceae bacterium B102]|nr:LuxR family transcriptional regulator [Acidothermaceae bacterium B102]
MPHATFVGRAAELAALDAAGHAAIAGSGGLVLVAGETGVGKSRLIAEFVARSQAEGVRVLRGSGVELLGGSLPYGLVLDLLLSAGDASPAELFAKVLGPDHSAGSDSRLDTGADPGIARIRLLAPLLGSLVALTENGPIVLVVEDLHWADPSSLDAITWLINKLPTLPVALVATYRTSDLDREHPLRRMLVALDHHPSVTRLELGPLSRDDVAELASTMAGAQDDAAWVDEVHRRSEGNAFFAEELLRVGPEARLSDSLHDVLMSRVHPLGPDARQVVEVMSVMATDASEPLLGTVLGLEPRQLRAALRTLRDREVVVEAPDRRGYRFRHALLGDAVHDDLLDGERRLWHQAIAAALSEGGVPRGASAAPQLVAIAHHWYESGDLEQALPASIEAALALQGTFAFAEAYQQFARSLALSDQLRAGDKERVPLLDQAAEAARWAGRTEDAVGHLEDAVRLAEGPEAERFERLGQALWEAGQTTRAQEAYASADALSLGSRGPVRARVLAEQARYHMLEGRFVESEALCRQAVELAEDGGYASIAIAASITLGVSEALSGHVDAGLARLEVVREQTRRGGSIELLARAFGNSAAVLAFLGRLDESVDISLLGLRLMRDRGIDLASAGRGTLTTAAAVLFWRGRWDEAEQLVREVLDEPLPSRHAPFLRLTLGEIAMARGEMDEAERHLTYCRDRAEHLREHQLVAPTLAALAALRAWQGRPAEARAIVAEALRGLPDNEREDLGTDLCAVGLRACADTAELEGRRDVGELEREADALLAKAEALTAQVESRGASLPECRVMLAQARGERGRLAGDPDVDVHYREAAEGWVRLQRPFPTAYARWREGQALLLRRQTAAAEPLLRDSLVTVVRLRCRPLVEAVSATLRAARLDPELVDAAAPAPRRRPARATDELTERELEVLAVAADGLTNKEIGRRLFISDRTVGLHLAHAMERLGARNRLEAVQIAQRRGLLSPDTT